MRLDEQIESAAIGCKGGGLDVFGVQLISLPGLLQQIRFQLVFLAFSGAGADILRRFGVGSQPFGLAALLLQFDQLVKLKDDLVVNVGGLLHRQQLLLQLIAVVQVRVAPRVVLKFRAQLAPVPPKCLVQVDDVDVELI